MSGRGDGTTGAPEPGWYADPDDIQQIRWWDGAEWSGHVRPATDLDAPPETVVDPPVPPPAATVPPPQPPRAPSTPSPETALPPMAPAAPGVPDGGRAEPAPRPGRRPGRRVLAVVAGVLVLAALVGGGLFASGVLDGEDDATAVAVQPVAEEVAELFLEPVGDAGPAPFTSPLGERDPFVPDPVAVSRPDGGTEGVLAVASDTPGLYGGTGEKTCDVEALLEHLEGDPDKRQAFADVLGVAPDVLEEHVAGLVPVLLSRDTRVTNHGYVDGEATPRQSVLQAGTAVLVDDRGVPRVRCECGNPLLKPTQLGEHEIGGDGWPGYERAESVAVEAATDALESLTVQTPDGLEEISLRPVSLEDVDFANRSYPDTCFDGYFGSELVMTDGRTGPLDGSNGAPGAAVDGPHLVEGEDGQLALVAIVCTGRTEASASVLYLYDSTSRSLDVRETIDLRSSSGFSSIVAQDGNRFTTVTNDLGEFGDGPMAGYGSMLIVDRFELDVSAGTFERLGDFSYRISAADAADVEGAVATLTPLCEGFFSYPEDLELYDPLPIELLTDGRVVTIFTTGSGDIGFTQLSPALPPEEASEIAPPDIYDQIAVEGQVYVDEGRDRLVCSVTE